MEGLWIRIVLRVLGGLVLLVLAVMIYCFLRVFYSRSRKPLGKDEYQMPPGREYVKYYDLMRGWMKDLREMEHTDHEITSHDGLTLRGKFYEYSPTAPIEILFHGYRGTSERDLCGGVERCFRLGHSAFIVDQRASGRSDGHVITFGVKERYDCVAWSRYVCENIANGREVIITGISMGAATVMLASEMELPENVVGVLADCGYTSAKDIISKIVREMHLPVRIFYPLIKLSGILFGGFNVDERSPIEAVANSKLPIIFFHGDADGFVPCYMSEQNHEACTTRKSLVIVPGADHGLCYLVDRDGYIEEMRKFFE